MNVCDWSEISDEALSDLAIRAMFQNQAGYRCFSARYKKEPEFSTNFMRSVRVYVLVGGCRYRTGSECAEVAAGQFIDLKHGRYHLQVGEDGVQLMNVYYLPEMKVD